MKHYFLYFSALIVFLFLSLSSLSTGPTGVIGDRTESPVSGGACNGCHDTNGSFTPVTTISMVDTNGMPITNGLYKPGHEYTMTISVYAPPVNTITPLYGSQSVILTSNNQQAGLLSNPTTGIGGTGNGARIYTLGTRLYLEHNQRSVDGVFNATWTAPPVGTGRVNVYAMGLAINNNGAFTGDNHAGSSLTLEEDLSIGVDKITATALDYTVYPNPAVGKRIFIKGLEGDALIQLTDLMGVQVLNEAVYLNENYALDLETLPAGVYLLQVQQGNQASVKQIRIV